MRPNRQNDGRPKGSPKLLPAFVCAFCLSLVVPGQPLHAQPGFQLDIDGGRVTLDARNAPLQQVFERIAGQTGIKVRFMGQARERRVTAAFSDLPFQQALKRLLTDVPGHMIVLGKDGAGYAGVTGVYVFQALGQDAPLAKAPRQISDIRQLVESMPRTELTPEQREALLDATNPVDRPDLEAVAAQRARLVKELVEKVQSGAAADNQPLLQSLRDRLNAIGAPSGADPAPGGR